MKGRICSLLVTMMKGYLPRKREIEELRFIIIRPEICLFVHFGMSFVGTFVNYRSATVCLSLVHRVLHIEKGV